jgi:outer membrane protein assembly factor BamB
MIYTLGGRRQLIVWHPESINSLDPETGAVLWTEPFPVQTALSVATPRAWGADHLFFTAFYNGSRLVKVGGNPPGAATVWRTKKPSEKDTEHLHSIMSTPALVGDYAYGTCSYGQLRCLKISTGERVWETLEATTTDGKEVRWGNAFLVRNGDRFLLANEKGELIIARLTPEGYQEISRAKVLEPTNRAAGRDVVWSHPAFANRRAYLRNDRELVCADLAN